MRRFVLPATFFAACLCLVPSALADDVAYAGSSSGEFGTMDLSTGVFNPEGNSGQTLAGLAVANGSIFASSYLTANGTLFTVDPATGGLTIVGNAMGVAYDDFGSTTSGLYAVSNGSIQELYSIDPTTGAATLIGPTGLGYGAWRGLSNNSAALYFADGPNLYTLNTSTGAATLVGPFGGGAEMGAMLTEDGVFYGGDDSNNTLDTIDPTTGTATAGPTPSANLDGSFYGLAPFPVPAGSGGNGPSPTPEPSSLLLLATGLAGFLGMARRKIATHSNLR